MKYLITKINENVTTIVNKSILGGDIKDDLAICIEHVIQLAMNIDDSLKDRINNSINSNRVSLTKQSLNEVILSLQSNMVDMVDDYHRNDLNSTLFYIAIDLNTIANELYNKSVFNLYV